MPVACLTRALVHTLMRSGHRNVGPDAESASLLLDLVHAALAACPDRLQVIGLCGAQGSGKSTLAKGVAARLGETGVPAAVLSLDDLYLTRAERLVLAHRVHPLFAIRGVPGTHDVALGLGLLAALDRGERTLLPCFDKALDDRAPPRRWPMAPEGTRVLLFEGWCIGAAPQREHDLEAPVNALERNEDRDCIWRRTVNSHLAGEYREVFARLDKLVLLAAPDFGIVHRWRNEQEEKLRAAGARNAMSEVEIGRFIQHYERLTRHVLGEMPGRADLVIALNADRTVRQVYGS